MTPLAADPPLPWQARAVLLGPFAPQIDRTNWYGGRQQRHQRHATPPSTQADRSAHTLTHTLINSVPVPVQLLRRTLQALLLSAQRSTAEPLGQHAWLAAFAADETGWHGVDVLAPTAPALALQWRAQAIQHIQALRQRALHNGGWWPAPQRITLAYHPAHAAMQGSMEFAAHYMVGGRTQIVH